MGVWVICSTGVYGKDGDILAWEDGPRELSCSLDG